MHLFRTSSNEPIAQHADSVSYARGPLKAVSSAVCFLASGCSFSLSQVPSQLWRAHMCTCTLSMNAMMITWPPNVKRRATSRLPGYPQHLNCFKLGATHNTHGEEWAHRGDSFRAVGHLSATLLALRTLSLRISLRAPLLQPDLDASALRLMPQGHVHAKQCLHCEEQDANWANVAVKRHGVS